jgi:RNase H-like domain found in reverse transcriptase
VKLLLRAALAKVFEGKTLRMKKSAAAVTLLHLWGPEEQAAFEDLRAAIIKSMTLAFPDPDKRICDFTDASDRFYAGLMTQIHEEQLYVPMEKQDHQPLAFLSGEFKGAQLRWTVPEKEGFAIVDTVTKVDYLLLSHDEFSVLSDHLNLTYIYNPQSADPTLARHVVHKLQRWALKMSVFSYRIEHVMGELNYWKDLMTRWGVGWVAGSENKAHGKMAASLYSRTSAHPTTIRWSFRRRRILYWCSRALSMSMSVASKTTRWLGKKHRRSKSMLVA